MAMKSVDVLPLDHIKADASFERATYHVKIPRKFTWEQVTLPEFWRNQERLKANDILDLCHEDGLFDCTARVVSADRGYVILSVIREWHAPVEQLQVEAATVGFVLGKGFVLFGTDGEPVASFADEDSAKAALADYLNKEQAAA